MKLAILFYMKWEMEKEKGSRTFWVDVQTNMQTRERSVTFLFVCLWLVTEIFSFRVTFCWNEMFWFLTCIFPFILRGFTYQRRRIRCWHRMKKLKTEWALSESPKLVDKPIWHEWEYVCAFWYEWWMMEVKRCAHSPKVWVRFIWQNVTFHNIVFS